MRGKRARSRERGVLGRCGVDGWQRAMVAAHSFGLGNPGVYWVSQIRGAVEGELGMSRKD